VVALSAVVESVVAPSAEDPRREVSTESVAAPSVEEASAVPALRDVAVAPSAEDPRRESVPVP